MVCITRSDIAGDLLMAQVRVEIVGNPRFETVEIDIYKERVAAGLDAGERAGNRSGRAGQSNQPGLTAIGANGRPRGRTGAKVSYSAAGSVSASFNKLFALGLAPEVAEADCLGRRMVRLTHERRDGGADLDADRICPAWRRCWGRVSHLAPSCRSCTCRR